MYLVALILGALVSVMTLVYFLRHPAFSMFHPLTIYSMFHFVCFVIRPFFGYWLDYHQLYRLYQFLPSESDKIAVIAAANIGYLAFAFSSLRAGGMKMRFAPSEAQNLERQKLVRPFIFAACLFGPIAIYSLSQNFVSDGNFDGMLVDRSTGIAYNSKSNGYLTDAQMMLAPICALIAWLGRFRLISLLPLVAFALVRGGSGGRGPFVAAIAMALMLYLYDRRSRFPTFRAGLIIMVGAAFFSFIGQNRGEELRQLVGLDQNKWSSPNQNQFMETMDLGNMEFFEYLVWVVPQKSGTYDFFLHNLQIFTEPVPRVLWSSKPIGPPIQPVRLFEYGTPVGITFSLPGVGWYSLGWLGVVIWCSLWGHATGTIYRKFVSSDQSTIKIAFYVVFISSLIVAFRDGMLISVIKQTGAFIAPVVGWYLFKSYFGVPGLSQILRASAKTVRGGISQTKEAADSSRLTQIQNLPPAVRRRRLALQSRSPN